MLLAIDVGNTQTVLGVYEGKKLRFRWRVATNKLHTCDELRVKLIPLLSSEGVSFDDISGVALASVVPALTDAWQQATKQMIGVRAVVCTAENAAGLFDAGDYPNPREIGADRIADCVAARMLYGSPVVVVDFGTATNMEVIDGERHVRRRHHRALAWTPAPARCSAMPPSWAPSSWSTRTPPSAATPPRLCRWASSTARPIA